MRFAFSLIFLLMGIALGICAAISFHNKKPIGRQVGFLLLTLIPPVIGNMFIIGSSSEMYAIIGRFMYFLGMDFVMYALLQFTFAYCQIRWPNFIVNLLVIFVLLVDIVQLLLNPVFHHAFATEAIIVEGSAYFKPIPYFGLTIHRIIDYAIFFTSLLIFLVKAIRTPRIYSEKYSTILLSMVLGGLWQTYYIFSLTPIDTSMISFAVFGFMVFYFSIFYKPVRLLDRMLANVASQMDDCLYFFDVSGSCIWANTHGRELIMIKEEQYENARERLLDLFPGVALGVDNWSERRTLGYGLKEKHYALEKKTITDARDKALGYFVTIHDYTKEHKAMEKEMYDATHDELTDLFTKEHLYRCTLDMINSDPDNQYLVLYIDVNDFKIINDIYGMEFGDLVLNKIAEWLRKAFDPDRTVYGRLGSDTFGVCLPESEFDHSRIEAAFGYFIVRNSMNEQQIQIHAGVYDVNGSEQKASVMYDRAHMALQTIKDEYQIHVAYYDDKMRDQILWNQMITAQLPEAITKKQVRPYLQPVVDDTGRVVGAEALVRWVHPEHGFLNPGSFVPVFEKNGMIAEVDKYMWLCACEILAEWKNKGRNEFISINISPKDFYFMDIPETLNNLVRSFNVDPGKLRIEITETVMMNNIEKRMEIINRLRQDGFIVEMDDFGSGYSSLNLLKDMPVDLLKIDMGFLNETHNEEKAKKIISHIISMAEDLGIIPLTEGVETKEENEMLLKMGCRLFQGYYFAKPMTVNAFEDFCFYQNPIS